MAQTERAPPKEPPMATSSATFSFGAHSASISAYWARYSEISVLGVPG